MDHVPSYSRTSRCSDSLRTKRYSFGKMLAMAAMVLQVLFLTDHLGASAAKAFGKAPVDARLGLMELCTGSEVIVVAADGTPVDQGHDCPICDSVAVMAFGEPAEAPCPTISFDCFADDCEIPNHRQVAVFRLSQQQPIRAPPSALS